MAAPREEVTRSSKAWPPGSRGLPSSRAEHELPGGLAVDDHDLAAVGVGGPVDGAGPEVGFKALLPDGHGLQNVAVGVYDGVVSHGGVPPGEGLYMGVTAAR